MNTSFSDTSTDARKDPDRLEREIDEQRREINETLRALEEKFSSRDIAGHLMNYFGGHGREWADSLGSSLKANPIPAMLTAIGVTWLMMSDRHSYRPSYSYASDDLYGAADHYDGDSREMYEGAASGAREAAEGLREKAGELGDKVSQAGEALHEKAAHMREGLRSRASHARDGLRSRASHAREGLSHSAMHARHVRDNFGQMAREQPLALGAVGIALGALIGAALPRTEHENRMLGKVSERVKQRGKDMARQGYEKASHKAAEVAQAAGEKLRSAQGSQQGDGEWQAGSGDQWREGSDSLREANAPLQASQQSGTGTSTGNPA